MKRIYLHIGLPKTGTTAIQNFLFKFSEELKSEGILYSRNLGSRSHDSSLRSGHHSLAYDVLGTHGYSDGLCWNQLLEEVRSSTSDTAVISAETFWLCSDTEIRKVAKYLESYFVKVVVYLRNPLNFVVSLYKQRIKTGHSYQSFRDFIDEFYTSYGYTLTKWASVFGKENIKVCIYDKVKVNPGLEEDFLHLLSIDPGRFPEYFRNKQNVNVSPQDKSILLMRRLNKFGGACRPHTVGSKMSSWARANIRKMTIAGRAILTLCHPFISGKLYKDDDVDYLRKKVAVDKPLLSTFIPTEDQAYFNF
jgi:hypothetical protein